MRIRHSEISCKDIDAVANAVPSCSLSRFGKGRLYVRLSATRASYDLLHLSRKQATPAEVRKLLKPIRGAISKLAALARDVNSDRASAAVFELLSAAGRTWAKSQPISELPEHLPVRPVAGGGTDYGTDLTLQQFLASAQTLDAWAILADKYGPLDADWPKDIKLDEWLIGAELPRLFEKTYPGRRYALSRSFEGALYGESLEFVSSALSAMKIKNRDGLPWADETIGNYRRRAKEAGLVQPRAK